MLLETKAKLCYTNDDSDWMLLDVNVNIGTTWNFDAFDFRLDGVIYTTATPEWHSQIKKAQIWAKLNR